MKGLNTFWKIIKNKYVIVMMSAFVWMLFFDRYDLPSQLQLRAKVQELQEDKEFYLTEIDRIQEKKDLLVNDPDLAELEKFAREKYYMKKDDEDLFIIKQPTN